MQSTAFSCWASLRIWHKTASDGRALTLQVRLHMAKYHPLIVAALQMSSDTKAFAAVNTQSVGKLDQLLDPKTPITGLMLTLTASQSPFRLDLRPLPALISNLVPWSNDAKPWDLSKPPGLSGDWASSEPRQAESATQTSARPAVGSREDSVFVGFDGSGEPLWLVGFTVHGRSVRQC